MTTTPTVPPPSVPPPPRSTDSEEGDEQDSLGACFKDAEYIYPSLESDEDDPALKSLPKRKKATDDAPWSPKARVTPSLPRQSRPVREGTRVASVETGLAAAAAKLAQQEHRKLQRRKCPPKRRPPTPPTPEEDPESGGGGGGGGGGDPEPEMGGMEVDLGSAEPEADLGAVAEAEAPPPPEAPYPPSLADHEYTARPGGGGAAPGRATTPMAPGVFLSHRRAATGTANNSGHGKRPKKGLATAKQRLGRILKIHRNGKLLL